MNVIHIANTYLKILEKTKGVLKYSYIKEEKQHELELQEAEKVKLVW